MEPASIITQIALAAAALVPTAPHIEVNFRDWKNKQGTPIDIYQGNNPASLKWINLMAPSDTRSIPIALNKDISGSSVTLIRLIPGAVCPDYIDMIFHKSTGPEDSFFEVMGTAQHLMPNEIKGLCVAGEIVRWKSVKPPKAIAIEIGGTIGMRWDDVQVQVTIQKNVEM